MANQIPLKALFDGGGNVTSLGQFTPTDTVSVADGGTGVANFTIGNGFLSLPGATGINPTLFSTINSLMIYPASGSGDRTFLETFHDHG